MSFVVCMSSKAFLVDLCKALADDYIHFSSFCYFFLLIIKRKKKSKRETLRPLSILLLLTYKSILKILSSFYWELKSKVLIIFVVKFIFFKEKDCIYMSLY